MESRPTMYVLAGPNGAGKSTLYEQRVRAITDVPFVNADEIRQERQAQGEELDAYEAARLAGATRDAYLHERRSFVTETVFSHESKLDLIRNAQAQGFRVVIFHVNVQSADISVARVRFRVTQGGHDVPEHKIRERYERNKRHIRAAVALADLAQIFDSSKANAPARHILTFKQGQLDKAADHIPGWAKAIYGL
ncbi:zeta toxin family protein [Salinisphaera hydrothermalis]|nr:zeta toxin family protein [Salinisphaera hydrothermalis]